MSRKRLDPAVFFAPRHGKMRAVAPAGIRTARAEAHTDTILLGPAMFIVALLVLLALLGLSLRRRPLFAVGVLCGVALAWLGAAVAPRLTLMTIPIWLPPLPFALVAVSLFTFGALAWWWGPDR